MAIFAEAAAWPACTSKKQGFVNTTEISPERCTGRCSKAKGQPGQQSSALERECPELHPTALTTGQRSRSPVALTMGQSFRAPNGTTVEQR